MKPLFSRISRRLRRLAAPSATPTSAAPLQIYPGYEEVDPILIQSFADQTISVAADRYTDGFGVATLFACVPFLDPATLDVARLQLPVPDDGFHAEAIEYLALVDALKRAAGRPAFTAVEIGAGWGPWITAAGVIARRRGCTDVRLVGVEAAAPRFALMRCHLETNRLRPAGISDGDASVDGVRTRLFNGAVWTHDGEIWFPESDAADMGSAATAAPADTDYRGAQAKHRAVPCRRLDTLLNDQGIIDFMHIDIQGAEFDLLRDQIDWLQNRVRTLMVATHSRVIEGQLVDLLLSRNLRLHREKPCRVDWARDCDLVGRTVVDGSQYWINPALA